MLMKKEVIEDNENLKEEIKDLKKQLEEEKNAYNRMYNMYVEKDNIIKELQKQEEEIERLNNIINELEKYCNEEIEDYDKNIKSQYITDIAKEQYEGEKVCFEDMLYKIKELKGSDKEWKLIMF